MLGASICWGHNVLQILALVEYFMGGDRPKMTIFITVLRQSSVCSKDITISMGESFMKFSHYCKG